MLPGASGSRWMPRKIAGSAMMTMDPSSGRHEHGGGRVRQGHPPVAVVRPGRQPAGLPIAPVRPGRGIRCSEPVARSAVRPPCSCLSSAWREPGREGLRQLLGPRVAAVPQHLQPGVGQRHDGPPAVLRVGTSLDEATRLERAERRPHRLRADLLELGQRAGRGRAAAVQAREGRALGQGELAFGLTWRSRRTSRPMLTRSAPATSSTSGS